MSTNYYSDSEPGMIWYVFFTKIRPWIAIVQLLNAEYYNILGLVCILIEFILHLVLFFASFKKSSGLLDLIRFYLISLFVSNMVYVCTSGFFEMYDGGIAIAVVLLYFILWYFIWYRLNVGYFRRRLIIPAPQYTDRSSDKQKVIYVCESPEDTAAYSAGNRFKCSKCGAYHPIVFSKCSACQEKNSVVAINLKEQINVDVPSDAAPASENHSPNFCKECGAKLAEGSKFCRNCGVKVI